MSSDDFGRELKKGNFTHAKRQFFSEDVLQDTIALALREIGKLERTLFLLEYIQNVELRKRIHAGLNKGEARNALARAVFFNRLGNCATAPTKTSSIEPVA
jgi:TnpA family transposase